MHIAVGFFLFANYMLVTSFLGLPFAFFHGGVLAGILTLAVVAAASRITANWLLEVMARAQVSALIISHTSVCSVLCRHSKSKKKRLYINYQIFV